MHTFVRNKRAKFHCDLIRNNGAVDVLKSIPQQEHEQFLMQKKNKSNEMVIL